MKRRLRRFGFDILKLSTSQIRSQEQSNSECPLDVLYTHSCALPLMAIGVPVCQRLTFGIAGCYIYIWRGVFYVARFDYEGHVERPQNVKRATVQGFTSFLCLYVVE